MSDIAGPPAPKEIQSPIRGADKTAHVAKDPNNTNTPTGDQPREQTTRDQGEARHSREPAVSIASSATHLSPGQEITENVARIDAEGRPIIVTETVTLALKPDAGLQPNDIIQLKVIDAGKQVTADLLRQNAQLIDPPVRLSITVIEIHGPGKQPETISTQQSVAKLDTPYHSPTGIKSSVADNAPKQTADLTALIGSKANLSGYTDNKPTATPVVNPDKDEAGSNVRSGPAITSSADLATLIQQQSTTATETPAAPPLANSTAITGSPFATSGPGVGPAINSVSVSGAPAIIQVLDTSISTVSPAEVASVKTVHTITAAEAIALPIDASTFGAGGSVGDPTSGELVKLETTRGDFILRATDAASLGGELVRVSIGPTPGQPSTEAINQEAAPKFPALLIESKPGAIPAKIDVSLIGPSNESSGQTGNIATIISVQTVAAFFGADGPKTDLRLQTNRGDISLTVPSGVRPQVGDSLAIIVRGAEGMPATGLSTLSPASVQHMQSDIAVSSTDASATASLTTTGQPMPHTAMPGPPTMLASWPALEESLTALLGTNAAAANSLAAKTAQGGSKLTNSLLFFLKAAGLGDSSNWIGSEIEQALSRSSKLALGNLRSDVSQMLNLAGETIGEWRPVLLPFDARGSDVPLAALLFGQRFDVNPDDQRNEASPGQEEQEKGQRFILQVQFSMLGDIQLDGNIRKQAFDLMIRSKNVLPSALQQDTSELFYAALAANDYTGSINFNQQDQFSIDAATLIQNHMQGDAPA